MAEIESHVMSPAMASGGKAVARPRTLRKFYVAMSIVLIGMIFVGFWPSYYGPLTRGATSAPWILHVHGMIFIAWMFLLVLQTVLAALGKIQQHRSVGNYGIALGSAVFVMGLIVSFVAPVMTFNAGTRTLDEAAAFLLIPLGDMALFGPLFFTAVAKRRNAELHKRLMLLATIAMAFAAIFRMQALGLPIAAGLTLWFALPVICVAYDLKACGKIHPVYWIGIAGMIAAALRIPFSASETWIAVARPIIEALS
jgi:uncharacterized membrane protein YozB (DUF420 family)